MHSGSVFLRSEATTNGARNVTTPGAKMSLWSRIIALLELATKKGTYSLTFLLFVRPITPNLRVAARLMSSGFETSSGMPSGMRTMSLTSSIFLASTSSGASMQ